MNKLSIIILAAGEGSRMKSNLPKVLHKISGREMIYYSINEALKISEDITVVLYHQSKMIEKVINKYFSNIKFIIQDHINYPGTGGALRNIKPKNEHTLVLNGDMPLIKSSELEKIKLTNNETIKISIFNLKNPSGYGRVILKNNQVKEIVEEKDTTEKQKDIKNVNAGIYLFHTTFLIKNIIKLNNNNKQKEYYITDLVSLAISNNHKVSYILVNENNFKGVNSKLDLTQCEEIHQNRIKKEFLLNGVIMKLPNTIYIDQSVIIKGESIIESGVSLLGNSKIINSNIKTNSIVEEAIIEDSSIGPIARIRPYSIIKNSKIGNYVEIKSSKLTKVKAGHLSYLGNSTIKENTNIGAGTITCNYDGINKHSTQIGKNVFIGSNTQLIAPLIIEDDTIIAAGSTITKNIKKGQLAISRPILKTIEGFYYKFFQKK